MFPSSSSVNAALSARLISWVSRASVSMTVMFSVSGALFFQSHFPECVTLVCDVDAQGQGVDPGVGDGAQWPTPGFARDAHRDAAASPAAVCDDRCSPERLMMVLHLFGGPHVGVDHSADITLVAGADEPFHCCVAGVNGNFAGLSQDFRPLVEGSTLFGVDPRFCDVEVVEFCADSAIGDGRLKCIEADGGDPGLHRLVGEHVWVRQR